MKFSCQVDIDLPRDQVIKLFDNPDNLTYWQDGFVSFKHISGEVGKPGAQSEMIYKMGSREMVLLETVVLRDLPHAFHGTYEGKFGKNSMNNYFEELGPNKTRWKSDLHYIKTNGIIIKIMTKYFPSKKKQQTQKWMDQFKAWSESVS